MFQTVLICKCSSKFFSFSEVSIGPTQTMTRSLRIAAIGHLVQKRSLVELPQIIPCYAATNPVQKA